MGAQGTATLDFGAFPGGSDTTVAVTGQTGILAGSLVEAWILPSATADHTADEHWCESLRVMAGNVVAGTGFTIYGLNTSTLFEPLVSPGVATFRSGGSPNGEQGRSVGGLGTRIYGAWNIAWCWN